MLYRWMLASLSTVSLCLLLPYAVEGQEHSAVTWQGTHLRPLSLQSPEGPDSSQQSGIGSGGQPITPIRGTQPSTVPQQSLSKPHKQKPTGLNIQELPPVWPQAQPATLPQPRVDTPQLQEQTQQQLTPVAPVAELVPGYLGANTRDFYRERFCMHALTIRGVEVETVLPDSPAAQAGLRPARALTAKETVVATAAGVLTLTPAAAAAPALVRFGGGVPHGDIILAVNGQRVADQEEFDTAMRQLQAQTTVYFTVHRGETNIQVPVRLTTQPTPAYAAIQ